MFDSPPRHMNKMNGRERVNLFTRAGRIEGRSISPEARTRRVKKRTLEASARSEHDDARQRRGIFQQKISMTASCKAKLVTEISRGTRDYLIRYPCNFYLI